MVFDKYGRIFIVVDINTYNTQILRIDTNLGPSTAMIMNYVASGLNYNAYLWLNDGDTRIVAGMEISYGGL